MPRGGARPGSGQPSKFQVQEREKAAKEKLTASKVRRKAALAAAQEQMEEAAARGERWAVELLLNHELGRPTQKAQVTEDTRINLVHRWLRKPLPCPHCGKIIRSFEAASDEPKVMSDEPVEGEPEPEELQQEEEWEDPFEV
jgi:hypothetical protein